MIRYRAEIHHNRYFLLFKCWCVDDNMLYITIHVITAHYLGASVDDTIHIVVTTNYLGVHVEVLMVCAVCSVPLLVITF